MEQSQFSKHHLNNKLLSILAELSFCGRNLNKIKHEFLLFYLGTIFTLSGCMTEFLLFYLGIIFTPQWCMTEFILFYSGITFTLSGA